MFRHQFTCSGGAVHTRIAQYFRQKAIGEPRCLHSAIDKMAMKQKEREFIVECIQLYRDLPALWNVKSKAYHDREKKNNAYEVLLKKYRKLFPEATKEDVKKKFNSLRTNYRKEVKKHLRSIQSGTDDIYEPTLWYYEEMKFLQDLQSSTDTQSEDMEEEEEEMFVTELSSMDENCYKQEDSTTTQPPSTSYIISNPKTKTGASTEDLKELVAKRLSDKLDPEYVNWALACAADLSKMEPMQQIYAKKAIADIIMEGQLALLHRHSLKINGS